MRRIFDEYLAGDGAMRIARRVHRGEVVGPANWPALIDDVTFERVQAAIETRSVRVTGDRRPRLLVGVARCGVCTARMAIAHDHKVRRAYQCKGRFCVARDMIKLDAYVTARLLEVLARVWMEVAELRARLDEAVASYTAGGPTTATLARIEADLGPRIAQAERRLRAQLLPVDVELPAGDVGELLLLHHSVRLRRQIAGER